MEKKIIMIINKFDENIIGGIIDLRIKYFKEAYDELNIDDEIKIRKSLYNYLKKHIGVDCFIAIKIIDEMVISTAILNIFTKAPNKRFPNGKYGEIYGVYTKGNKRCNGYATNLIKELINFSKNYDLSFIELEESSDGLSVYSNCGFVKEFRSEERR